MEENDLVRISVNNGLFLDCLYCILSHLFASKCLRSQSTKCKNNLEM